MHALRKDYGFSDVKSDSPMFKSLSADGSRMTVRFLNAERMRQLVINHKDQNICEVHSGIFLCVASCLIRPVLLYFALLGECFSRRGLCSGCCTVNFRRIKT